MSYPFCKHGHSSEMIPCPACEAENRLEFAIGNKRIWENQAHEWKQIADTNMETLKRVTAERDTARAQCAGLREEFTACLARLDWAIQYLTEKPFKQWHSHDEWAELAIEQSKEGHAALATDPGNAFLARLKAAEADSARIEWLETNEIDLVLLHEHWQCETQKFKRLSQQPTPRDAIDAAFAARAKEAE